MSQTPRVSILIPNFNNGKTSSRDGETDLIGDLLTSLRETLAEETTAYEVIAYDDGSTDDSLPTLRRWADEGFLRLIEAEHCGVLARTANRLVEASRGEILVRLDGDIVVLTPGWVGKLCAVFDAGPAELGVVGPKQLAPNGKWVHSFGDFVLHPRGYVHLHQGKAREEVTRPAEVDHVMGCFYCCKREVHDALGGYDEDVLRGQTVEFGMRARRAGYRCFAVPHIEFIHRHSLRGMRANLADTAEGIDRSRAAFKEKWGFDRLAPDLDVVRERYGGTPLLWNAAVFGLPGDAAYACSWGPEPTVEGSSWSRYAKDAGYRKHVDFRSKVVRQLADGRPGPVRVGLIGAGEGLLAHLLTVAGFVCVVADPFGARVALGRRFLGQQRYDRPGPEVTEQADPRRLPWADGSVDVVFWPGGIETHPNPVAMLREAGRVMAAGGVFGVVSPQVAEGSEGYLPHELATQVRAANEWVVPTVETPANPRQPLVALAAHDEAVFGAALRREA
ncbi:MAG: glycosyltransferase [Planctomycetota bacterium]